MSVRERKSLLRLLPPRANSRLEKFKKSVLLVGWGVALAQIAAIPFWGGAALGYLSARYFAGRSTGQPGRLRSRTFSIGPYRIHLHHWTLSSLFLTPLLLKGFYVHFLEFFLLACGFCAALVFHGIYSYTDWYRVVSRKSGGVH